MAEEKKKPENKVKVGDKLINLSDKVTLYAPAKSKYHKPFQEVQIHPEQVEKFKKAGFTEEAPKEKEEEKK